MEAPTTSSLTQAVPEFLSGGGEMGKRMREYDWASSPLGAVEQWPQSLRTCVRIMLTSQQPIWLGWGKELIKLYNDPYKAIVGGKHPRALGSAVSTVWKDIWNDIEPLLNEVLQNDRGTYVESQLLIMHRNGYPEETYYTFSYTPIPGDDGKTAGVFCANTDDTQKIISERQLRTLTQLGKRLADCRSNNEVIRKTVDTISENPYDFPFAIFRSVEDQKAVLRYSSELGEVAEKVEHTLDLSIREGRAGIISKALETGKLQIFEGLVEQVGRFPTGAWDIAPDKAVLLPILQAGTREPYGVLTLGLNPFRLVDDKMIDFLTLIADQVATSFSDVHVLEEERKRSEALAELDRAKTTFFSNISHEFRTPLTLLLSPIEDMLQDASTLPVNRPRVEVAYRNALRLQKLVNTLLEFSRIEAGRMEASFEKVDICGLTGDLASTFRSMIEKAGMQLVLNLDLIEADVFVDVEMWERIVLNLLSNAFKYCKEGSITVRIFQQGQEIVLQVSDTGIGIPGNQLDRIFERFHRVENSLGRSQEGTGIGLAMVKELVKLHGGTIEAQSVFGEGTTFTVRIPCGEGHVATESRGTTGRNTIPAEKNAFVAEASKWLPDPTPVEESTAESTLAFTVLIADDNADMRDYVRRLLADRFRVILAGDGEYAFELAMTAKPDLILSDVMMPRLDGFGLLQKIRSVPSLRNTPVIFLSARAGEEARIEGLDAGADDYLVKPFSAKELIVRVSNHIRISKARRQAEQQLYELFLHAPAMINTFLGPELRFDLFHPRSKELLGDDRDFSGIPVAEAMPELKEQGVVALLQQVYNTGMPLSRKEYWVRLVNQQGQEIARYMDFVLQPWFDHSGAVKGVISYANDVTEAVMARKKVEESEAYFRRLADTVPAILWITEADGQCSYLSKRWHDLTGQTREEALGQGWLQAIHSEDAQKVRETFFEANGLLSSFNIVFRLNEISGGARWCMTRATARHSDEGAFLGYIGTVIDIHEEILATERLRESETQLRLLAETLPQLVWVTDDLGKMEFASSRWRAYTGLDPDDMSWNEVLHPDDKLWVDEIWKHSLESGNYYKVELRLRDKHGNYRWFFGQGEPVKNARGEIVRWIGAFTDIQDQKEIEKNLEQLISERTNELQRSNHDLQQFAHVASHDLKEPVRKVRTFSSRLQEEYSDVLPEKGQLFLEKIQSATERMYAMIEGVLRYSTLNASQQQTEKVDLNQVLANVEGDLEVAMQQKAARLIYEKLPEIEGAGVLLHQLFYNLINNSLKFSREDVPPVIEVSSTPDSKDGKEYVRLIVKDNGIGFQQQYADRIFSSFTRLHSKDRYEGTGLGLALCRKIVERHQGRIDAIGIENEGAVFTIVLPLVQQQSTL